jgi:protein gp37
VLAFVPNVTVALSLSATTNAIADWRVDSVTGALFLFAAIANCSSSTQARHSVEGAVAETQIEWTDATWNPVAGCSIVSPGCTNCYAMEMARRLDAMGMEKYSGLTRRSGKRTVWTGFVREDRSALQIPLRWKRPKKIFVNSMSDLFHETVSNRFIADVWTVMRMTPQHHYQILTKRPERMAQVVRSQIAEVLPNVWLGTSIENQEYVGRIAALRCVPSAIRFISFEPLIGPVGTLDLTNIHWAIVGGESGKGARPIKEAWVDEIYDQCLTYETAFFFKQWGAWGKDNKRRSKKANGRLYRGQTWDDMPSPPTEAALPF